MCHPTLKCGVCNRHLFLGFPKRPHTKVCGFNILKMKLTLNTEGIYEKLSNPEDYVIEDISEEDEEFSSPIKSSLKDIATFYFTSRYVQLPMPFEGIGTTFMKKEENYSGTVSLKLNEIFYNYDFEQNFPTFLEIGRALRKIYRNKWVPIDSLGRGYITDSKKTNPLVIIGGKDAQYDITIGEGGTKSIRLDGLDEFAGNIGRLENVSENFMNLLSRFAPFKTPPKNLELSLIV